MASLLFGNNHRLKLVDDEEDGGPTESSFRTDWSSILKPNRRPAETRLSKEDSMASFDTDSLFSSAEGSGEPDSLAPQASSSIQVGGAGGAGGGSRRSLPLPPSYSNGRATPDSTMALAPSVTSRRTKSLIGDSTLDSMLPTLASTNLRYTGSTTTASSSSRQGGSFGSDFFAHPSDGGKGSVSGDRTSHTLKSETSLSFFDPNASRESFFLDDHTAEEQDDIDDSGRHTTRPLVNGYPSSRSIPLEGSFSAFSLEPDDEDEADELISPGTPATGTSYPKPKLGLVRHDMPTVRWRTADFGVEDFQVTTPTSRSERSRSRRSLPSSLFRSAPMVEHDTMSPTSAATPNRSLRGNRRTTKTGSLLKEHGKSPRLSATAIDLTKADEIAREKSNTLKAHRSSVRVKSMQRSSNRTKICKDRETIEGRLNNVLGGGDYDDDGAGFPPVATPEGSHRSRRSSNGNSTKKQSSRRSSQRERSSSNDFDFDDDAFPDPMSKSSNKTQVLGSYEHNNDGTSSSGCPTIEASRNGQLPESESSRRTRTLDKKIAKENRDKNALTESIRVNERPSLTKSSETNKSRRNLKDNTNTATKAPPTVEDDTKKISRRTRASSPRKSRIMSETSGDNSKVQAKGEDTLQAKFPLTRQSSKKGLNMDEISGIETVLSPGKSESIWEKIEREKERKQKIRDHIQVIQNDTSHLVSPSASRNKSPFADFENNLKSLKATLTTSAPEDSFNVDFNTTFFDATPKQQVGAAAAPREVAKVEPKIIRPSLGPTIPSRLKEPVQNKEESLDLSGHTNYTRSANWNWEEDHWDESKNKLCHPTTIQEGDENADDTYGSPIVQTRKTLDSSFAKSPDFLSPIVHKKKFTSSTPVTNQPKLNDFFQTTNAGDPAHWMETLKADRSVSSAPSMDPFPMRELNRTKSMGQGRPPRPLVPERQPRRSDPNPCALTETPAPTARRQQRPTAHETPSPRAVKDVFDQENDKKKAGSGASKGVVRRSSGSARRDTHEQRKGAVRDAMFSFLNAEDD